MSIVLEMKEIKRNSKLWDNDVFLSGVEDVNEETARKILADYRRTTETWDEQPDFVVETQVGPDSIQVLVGTDDPVYRYVDLGTSVRHALMSPDFSPKTRPGKIASYPGSGRVVVVSRNIVLPGIEARRFSEIIEERHRKPYLRAIHSVMKKARSVRNG